MNRQSWRVIPLDNDEAPAAGQTEGYEFEEPSFLVEEPSEPSPTPCWDAIDHPSMAQPTLMPRLLTPGNYPRFRSIDEAPQLRLRDVVAVVIFVVILLIFFLGV